MFLRETGLRPVRKSGAISVVVVALIIVIIMALTFSRLANSKIS
jgi:hypothetical protein